MSVASMLENMKRRALDSTYDAYICEEYDAWAVESFATEEGEYDAARLELPKVLSSEQMEKLKTMEERYRQNRKYASHYTLELYAARIFDNPKWVDYEAFAKHYGYQPQSYEG